MLVNVEGHTDIIIIICDQNGSVIHTSKYLRMWHRNVYVGNNKLSVGEYSVQSCRFITYYLLSMDLTRSLKTQNSVGIKEHKVSNVSTLCM